MCAHAVGALSPARAAPTARGPHKTLKRASWSLRREVLISAAHRLSKKAGSRSKYGAGKTATLVGSSVWRSPSRTAEASSGYHRLR